jgi:hypothetical protein
MKNTTPHCPECGTAWSDGLTCEDHFHQMAAWEFEDLDRFGQVHHLMVLCYHLQHPSRYSPEGLMGAKSLLVDFLTHGISPQEVRRRDRAAVDSHQRKYKITGTPESHGTYAHPPHWTMTAADVTRAGAHAYCDSVRAWAASILASLTEAGEL